MPANKRVIYTKPYDKSIKSHGVQLEHEHQMLFEK
jgi:hypothetical protein